MSSSSRSLASLLTSPRPFSLVSWEAVEVGEPGAALTHDRLRDGAFRAAAFFARHRARGSRALLALPPGPDFLIAFFGCVCAGVIAVPVPEWRGSRGRSRLDDIIRECEPQWLIAAGRRRGEAGDVSLQRVSCEDLVAHEAMLDVEPLGGDTPAYLQFTSGSTGRPRGVIVTHDNVFANLRAIGRWADLTTAWAVSWLPFYHDMGLINALFAVDTGLGLAVESPERFMQRPWRWLQTISRVRACYSGGPNFAYELLTRTGPPDSTPLDLSCWTTAFCGAEPVRPQTMRRFASRFSSVGFRPEALSPAYGLAEFTLGATAVPPSRAASFRRWQDDAPGGGVEQDIAECGEPLDGTTLRIVDPEAGTEMPEGQVGEIWLAGASKAAGYWGHPLESAAVFGAVLDGEARYLRTGDLGFLERGRLYVVGRAKELVIVRGRNFHPHTIEQAVQAAHPALEGIVAAFAIDSAAGEGLAVVCELRRSAVRRVAAAEVFQAIQGELVRRFDIAADAIALVKPGAVPRTTSGKLQRLQCRDLLRGDALATVATWSARSDEDGTLERPATAPPDQAAIAEWITRWIEVRLAAPPDAIHPSLPLADCGLDSVRAVQLTQGLEDWLGLVLDQTLPWRESTIEGLSRSVARLLNGSASADVVPTHLPPTACKRSSNALNVSRSRRFSDCSWPACSKGSPMQDFITRIAGMSKERLTLLALDLQNRLEANEHAFNEPIAIVGMGCRLPGAPDVDSYWRLLCEGRDSITEIPGDRWDVDAYYSADPEAPGKMYTRHGGFIERPDLFDAQFFGISSREARAMDPQQRLILEVAWRALEDAHVPPATLSQSRTGVFVGQSTHDYMQYSTRYGALDELDAYVGTGTSPSVACGRLSYILGLAGPSFAVDTACSSSLVAVHLACTSLRRGDCDLALAGGVNVMAIPGPFVYFSKLRALAPDGRCKTFDASANGYGRGEGCGVIVLKRLSDAIAAADRIVAIVRGSAVNHDGRSNGLTVPNGRAQEAVVREALAQGRVLPQDIGYVEAHGTGTPLGDPIELHALGNVHRGRTQPLLVGSVKTNFGHLEAAAGIAGLIKAALVLRHREVPPHLHLQRPNPYIDWAHLPIATPTTRTPCPVSADGRALAGVSSFGFGGTNAHVVLEAAPERADSPRTEERPAHILCLSARSEAALHAMSGALADRLSGVSDAAFGDICFSTNAGGSHFEHRLAVRARSAAECRDQLTAFVRSSSADLVAAARVRPREEARVAFLCSGQGAQYVGMGRALFEAEPRFRESLRRCETLLGDALEQPLTTLLWGEGAEGRLDRTENTQPALFALEYALGRLWLDWGIRPHALLGHSIGEYAAACLAGVFSLEDALSLVSARGRLMQARCETGAMVALECDAATACAALAGHEARASVAAFNGPRNTVISGAHDVVAHIAAEVEARGIRSRRLSVSHAFHSPLMEPMLADFASVLRGVRFSPPQWPLISNLTGRIATADELTSVDYWVQQIRQPVQFEAGVRVLFERGMTALLEVGPKPVLLGLARQVVDPPGVRWLATLRPPQPDWHPLLDALRQLYVAGVDVDWKAFDAPYARRWTPVPGHPFQPQRFWLDLPITEQRQAAAPPLEAPVLEGAGETGPEHDEWLYRIEWEAQPTLPFHPPPERPQRWLVLAPTAGFAGTFAAAAGHECISVVPHGSCEQLSPTRWGVRPDSPADYQRLLEQVGVSELAGIVHAWAAAAIPTDGHPDPMALQQSGYQSVFLLAQALIAAGGRSQPPLCVVTQGAQRVLATEPVPGLFHSTLWGLVPGLSVEHTSLRCTLVDLDPAALTSDREMKWLVSTLRSASREPLLARRGGRTYAPRLLRSPQSAASPAGSFEATGGWLISGGYGGLGLHVADWLIARGVRKLALVGRSGASASATERISAWREAGVEVLEVRADVADAEATQRAVAEARTVLGGLHGVVHAAGAVDHAPVAQLDWSRCESLLAPKMLGAWNLHQATADDGLAHFICFSSVASVLAFPGQANYAAANAFLDAFARHRRALGLPALAINWGPWAGSGMAARLTGELRERWDAMGVFGSLDPADALTAFGRVLHAPDGQVAVMSTEWPRFFQVFPLGLEPPFLRNLAQEFNRLQPPTPQWQELITDARRASPEERRERLASYLEAECAAVLGLAPGSVIDREQGFFELGMDSLMSVELRNRLQTAAGASHAFPITIVFDRPNIGALAAYLERELLDVEAASAAVTTAAAAEREAIAIIGIGCRFPGEANDPETFWQNLRNGVDAVREVPADRWDVDEFFDPDPDAPGKMSTRSGGFIGGIDQFDAHFFGISPREASRLDPQHRLLLETTWHALEHACKPPTQLANTPTGVFVGVSVNDYVRVLSRAGDVSSIDAYLGVGNALSMASGRIAHALGLQGPSLSIDTACSSSLVAVHLACESLLRRECELALAGGVNAVLVPEVNVSLSKARMLAADGRCKTFDARADGYGRGEGCGMVVLKRLSDAQRDGDDILAVIRGSAVNHDGRSSGLTVPNATAQEALIERALAAAGVEPDEIDYVEAHGTGTPLGDPIEVQSLGRVFRRRRSDDRPLLIGAVKTNIGHLESAAGIASLIKTTLALRHGEIPASLHFEQPNPYIPWSELPVQVVSEARSWPRNGHARRAGVSSFGFSGTNSHVVLEEAPPSRADVPQTAVRPRHVITVSAKTAEAATTLAERVAARIEAAGDEELGDICFSANAGRAALPRRIAATGATATELAAHLRAAASEPSDVLGTRPGIAFLFSGQGAQYAGMGRGLFETEPRFRAALLECERVLGSSLGMPLTAVLYGDGDARAALLDRTDYTQPALFAVEYALGCLWREWGIEPRFALGHSIGEYVAACLAGVFGVEDALTLVAARGRLMQAHCRPGAMASLECDAATAAECMAGCGDQLGLAALNGPANSVVSGPADEIERVVQHASARGITARRLEVSHAFHSPMMDPMLDAFAEVAQRVRFGRPRWTIVSNVTGAAVGEEEIASADYWVQHVRQPVQFERGMRALWQAGARTFLEVGPRPVLLGMARQIPDLHEGATWVPSLRPRTDDWEQMLDSVSALYRAGAALDWRRFDAPYGRRWVALPFYPFQAQRFWAEAPAEAAARPQPSDRAGVAAPAPAAPHHSLLGRAVRSPAFPGWLYENSFSQAAPTFLDDHRIYSMMVVPGASHLSMVCSAMAEIDPAAPVTITDVTFQEVLVVPDDEARAVQLVLRPHGTQTFEFEVHSSGDSATWLLHAAGRVTHQAQDAAAAPAFDAPDLTAIRARCQEELGTTRIWYQLMNRQGIQLGEQFQWVERVWRREGEALGIVRAPRVGDRAHEYVIHPGLLDSCFQLMGATLSTKELENSAYIPIRIERLHLRGRPQGALYVHVRLRPGPRDTKIADLTVFEQGGAIVAEIAGLRIHRAPRSALLRFAQRRLRDSVYSLGWAEQKHQALPADYRGRRVLVFGDEGPLADALERQLRTAGAIVVMAAPGPDFARVDDRRFRIDPADGAQFERVYREGLPEGAESWADVLFLWSATPAPELSPSAVDAAQQRGCLALTRLVQVLGRVRGVAAPRLLVATRRSQRVVQDGDVVDVTHAATWGLAGVVANELPQLRCVRVDLDDSAPDEAAAAQLIEELAATGEDRIAFRGGRRYVCRLGRLASGSRADQSPLASGEPYQLVRSPHGVIDELALKPSVRQQPGPGEVEILVEATALNFRDVLNALGLYPGDAGPLGGECVGTVVACGEGVHDLPTGARVLAIGAGTFNRFTLTDARMAQPVPDGLSTVDAATIPVAFVTAYYGLRHMAQLRPTDSVLVHAGAGGVGLAAIQYARHIGAEVFATAGSEEKRAVLRGLGVRHVYDSRSLDFADAITAETSGRGVDVVLNSLSGDFIEKSLGVTARGGRFVELGKNAIWTADRVAGVRPDVAYEAMALDTEILHRPEFVGEMLRDVMTLMADGSLQPLPNTAFAIADVADAFRFMAQARHVGKVVVTHPSDAAAGERPLVSADRSYLVTGGLGSLGVSVARRLAESGARHITLMGRRPPSESAAQAVAEIQEGGTTVDIALGDVSDGAHVAAVLARMRAGGPPLGGIFHAAGALDDALLMHLDDARFRRVLDAKLLGALHLHEQTRDAPLDHFVLFSSAAATLGTPGQGNYAAANACLDALAHARRQAGLTALSINWGPWADGGMAADASPEIRRQWAAMGVSSFTTKTGLSILEMLMREDVTQAVALAVDWDKLLRRYPAGAVPPLLAGLVDDRSRSSEPSAEWLAFVKRVEDALPLERRGLVIERLQQQAARVLGLDAADKVDPRTPLNEQGLDSLMAVELANQLGSASGVALPATQLFDYPTIDRLADFFLIEVLKLEERAPVAARREPAESAAMAAASLVDSITVLTDEEVAERLKQIGTQGGV